MRYCAQPGCSVLVKQGRCPTHARQIDQGTRGTAHARGYTSAWARYSAVFRQQHPICGEQIDGSLTAQHGSRCVAEGRTERAQCVDHIVPISQGGSVWDESNHQSLCLACNTAKANMLERQSA